MAGTTTSAGYRRRYTQYCAFKHCNRYRRDGDVFCGPDYFALPKPMQHALYRDGDELDEAIEAAKQWLEDKWNNALIVKEEGP